MNAGSDYELVQLANGVYSLHSLACDETFHPVIGPAAEAEALYVRQVDLGKILPQPQEFVVWDIGLGAAANPLTVLRLTSHIPGTVKVLSFDQTLEPLRFGLSHAEQLEYLKGYEPPLAELLARHAVEFRHGQQQVSWKLHLGDFPALLKSPQSGSWPKPHLIMFDAFSPAKNPGMWTATLFADLYRLLEPERPCVLPTYSRSTLLRVTLLLAGFYVGVGHATGEKEETTIAANCRELIAQPLEAAWLKRARSSTSAEPLRESHYRQAPMSSETWERLRTHRQFR